jgi:hypothetical protein
MFKEDQIESLMDHLKITVSALEKTNKRNLKRSRFYLKKAKKSES